MNEPVYPAKKPKGCWKFFGWLLTIVSGLLFAFFISMIFYTDKELDKKRAEYSAYVEEYEEAMKAYEADSVHFQAPEWNPRGAIGDNIGGAFFLLFAIIMLVPFGIGLLMLIFYGYKKRKWRVQRETI